VTGAGGPVECALPAFKRTDDGKSTTQMDVWKAFEHGDLEVARRLLDDGLPIDEAAEHPRSSWTPLYSACYSDVARRLGDPANILRPCTGPYARLTLTLSRLP